MGRHSAPDPEITDCGHGHVFLRAQKVDCGGPGYCAECTRDLRVWRYLEHQGHIYCPYCAEKVGYHYHRCQTGIDYLRSRGKPEEELAD